MGGQLKMLEHCLAHVRSWVQTPVLPKTKQQIKLLISGINIDIQQMLEQEFVCVCVCVCEWMCYTLVTFLLNSASLGI
jgi:hypothetical protein